MVDIDSIVEAKHDHNSTSDGHTEFGQLILDLGGIPYVFSLCCIIIIFTVVCCVRYLCCCDRKRPLDLVFHRKIWMKPLPWKFVREYIQFYLLDITWGEMFLYGFYIANILIWFLFPCKKCFNVMDFNDYYSYSNGFGRLALFNLILMLFPAHRFSIFQFVFGPGVDKLLKFHKMFGVLVYVFVVIHFIMVLFDIIWQHEIKYIFKWDTSLFINQPLPGVISGLFMLGLSAFSLESCRRKNYCCFLYLHIFFASFMFLFLIFHRTLATFGLLSIGLVFTGLDFIYRFFILLVPVQVSTAEFIKSTGTAKIVLRRVGLGKVVKIYPGQVVYLWTSLKPLDPGHPFTVCSTFCSEEREDETCVSLYISKRGSFTSSLLSAIDETRKDKRSLPWIRFDGPYGSGGDFLKYSQIVFTSYGAFVAPVFGIIKCMIRRRKRERRKAERAIVKGHTTKKRMMLLIWQITKSEYFELFAEEIDYILKHMHIIDLEIKVFVKNKGGVSAVKKKKREVDLKSPENPASYLNNKNIVLETNPMSPIPGSMYNDGNGMEMEVNGIVRNDKKPTSNSPLLNPLLKETPFEEEDFEEEGETDSSTDSSTDHRNEIQDLLSIQHFIQDGEVKVDWEKELRDFGNPKIKTFVYLQGVHFFTGAIKKALSNVGWSRVFHYEEPHFDY